MSQFNNHNEYNDDLYMDFKEATYEVLPDESGDEMRPRQTPGRRPSGAGGGRKGGFGRKVLSAFLAICFTAAVSIGSISGYVWYMNQNGGGTTVDGGTRVIYTLAEQEGALTSQEIFVKASPWVVSITSYSQSRYGTSTSTGTGIIMSEDGYIITNHHVISGATKVVVTLKGGKEYTATVVGSEAKTDIAVLKIAANGLDAAEFGTSAELVVGDTAIVIGNPLGLEFADTMTQGIISSTEREVSIEGNMMSLIQTTAAVNPGNSGGPIINSRGQVIGVVNAKIAQENVEGIGFAIPIDKALQIVNDLIDYGYVASRPMLGITVQSISEEQAYYYGYEAGVTVTEVTTGSSADLGGVKVGDKILAFNGVAISTADELNFQKEKCSIGDVITMTVERAGEEIVLTITLSAGTVA